jgi:hypothetical protein
MKFCRNPATTTVAIYLLFILLWMVLFIKTSQQDKITFDLDDNVKDLLITQDVVQPLVNTMDVLPLISSDVTLFDFLDHIDLYYLLVFFFVAP